MKKQKKRKREDTEEKRKDKIGKLKIMKWREKCKIGRENETKEERNNGQEKRRQIQKIKKISDKSVN